MLGKATSAALVSAYLLIIHMLLLASSFPVMRSVSIHVAGWPSGALPIRVALLSDMHVSYPSSSPERLSRIVDRIDEARPDIILLAGDFLSNGSLSIRDFDANESIAPLGALRAPKGVWAIFGNHDSKNRPQLKDAFERYGITLLRNEARRVGFLTIIGIDYSYPPDAYVAKSISAWRRQRGIPITIVHSPDAIPLLPSLRPIVVLAGHTHCGQIRLPIFGPVMTALHVHRRYACGVVRDSLKTSVISAGIGTSIVPLRLGVPPDFWIITIGA
jgi:predicted MPP superfamily phosphohydrolase